MTLENENVTCPFCGGIASIHDLGRAGLSAENLQELMDIVQAGQAPEMLLFGGCSNNEITQNLQAQN